MTDQVIERDRLPKIWQFRNVFLNGVTAPEFALFFQQKNTGCRELFGYGADVEFGIGSYWLFQFEVREACLVFVHHLALFNQADGKTWGVWAQTLGCQEGIQLWLKSPGRCLGIPNTSLGQAAKYKKPISH